MKKLLRYFLTNFIAITLLTSAAYSLPDLTLTSLSLTPVNVGHGQIITATLQVKNIGISDAVQNHIALYLSPTLYAADGVLLSQISLEAIAAGASSNAIYYNYPVPYNVPSGTNYLIVIVDNLNEVDESDELNNNFYFGTTLNVSGVTNVQKLPYPLIYIHGLIGSNSTWDSLLVTFQNYYGWSYGGNMNFCLNQDGNLYNAVLPNDYHDYTNISNLHASDFYTVNFAVDNLGNTYNGQNNPIESNQAAIVKQGRAIRDAIAHVLQVSGRDKVILVGHSMGGLASREYLQNPSIWQPDGESHVAKLLTVGTPNGGSNSTSFGLPIGLDEQSDAVRDLRYQYFISSAAGVHLFGGLESLSVMNNSLIWDYYNADVNCNGVIMQNITGLNSKSIPYNIAYTCIIGTGSLLGGDGVVDADRADLNNYPGGGLYADTFNLVEPAPIIGGTWHTELPKQVKGNVQGIDEANEYDQAYNVAPNQLYFGLLTKQSEGAPYVSDYDDFKIDMAKGNLNIKVYNIPISQFQIDVFNSSYNSVYTALSNGKSFINYNVLLNAGQYYFELSGTPTDYSWFYPYAFKLSYSSTTDIEESEAQNNFHCFNYPNPFNSTTTISFTLHQNDLVIINVYTLYGQKVSTLCNETMSEGKH